MIEREEVKKHKRRKSPNTSRRKKSNETNCGKKHQSISNVVGSESRA